MIDIVRKQSIAVTQPSSINGRRVRFTISTTDTVDRDGDIIQGPWDLKSYRANPIVLFSHNYASLPVGRSVSIGQVAEELIAEVEFTPAGLNSAADQCLELVKSGFLRGASVGFRPIDAPASNKRGDGLIYGRCELLEWSICAIPSNPNALVKALRASGAQAPSDEALMQRAAWLAASLAVAAEEGQRSMTQLIRELPEHEQQIVADMIAAGELG